MYAPLDSASSSDAAVGAVDPLPQESSDGEERLGFAFLVLLRTIPSKTFPSVSASDDAVVDDLTSRILCILAHFAVVVGLIVAGYRHFDNVWTGVAMATPFFGTQAINRCEPKRPASAGFETAIAPSHANTLLKRRSPGSVRKSFLVPTSMPLSAGLWNVPFPNDRIPSSG